MFPFRRKPPRTPDGRRIYAIGDVHGRKDALERLWTKIEADLAQSPPASGPALVVFLGDYLDRGPDSRGVVDFLLGLNRPDLEFAFLLGNHERAALTFLEAPQTWPMWSRVGGAATLFSYGVEAPQAPSEPGEAEERRWRQAARHFADALPAEHLRFLESLKLFERSGDYLFVHAGVDPGKPLAAQSEADLTGIREPFLSSRKVLPFVVVHGHSPVETATHFGPRIAVDTGAYATGRLSAVRLEGDSVSFLSATPLARGAAA